MKICYLANASSTHTKRWATAMRDKGCNIDIISFEDAVIEGVNVHYVKPIQREISANSADPKSLSYIVRAHKVKQILHNIKPDIVHAHYATGYGLTGALCGYKPLIISAWGSDVCLAPKRSILLRYMLKYNLGKADYITATSEYLTRETSNFTSKSISTIPFGVDTERFSRKRKNDGKDITIGIVKSLESVYGIEYLIHAFSKINSQYKDVRLLIVGNGQLKEELLSLCESLHISEKVTFTGNVENDSVPDFLNKMDIFVMPSLSESFGVSVLEAESCEIPVIATNIGGIPEVIRDGKTGFLVNQADSDAIAEKISLLINDKRLRVSMGISGRKLVEEKYSWKDSVNQMYQLYNDILHGKR